MSKIIAVCLLAILIYSCGPVPEAKQTVIRGKDKFDLVQTKAVVAECEKIASVSVHDDISPRYRIVTSDSMEFKSSRWFTVGDTIDVRVYKKRK